METVALGRLLADFRLASKLVDSGDIPAKLEAHPDVLEQLGIGHAEQSKIKGANSYMQVELLRPYVQQHLARLHAGKEQAEVAEVERLVEEVQRGCQHGIDVIELPVQPLTALCSIPIFDGLRLEPEQSVPWTFPRIRLGKILKAISGATAIRATLTVKGLTINYQARHGGRGEVVLLDQPIPSAGAQLVAVRLEMPRQRATAAAPVRQSPRPSSSSHDWLIEAAYALFDGLLAG